MARPRVIASIEARMGSTRLPGKVLADVGGRPALGRLLGRLRLCRRLDGIILATSTAAADDAVADWAATEGVACHRGSEADVLRRVVEAQRRMDSEVVVEICGDMTLLDPALVDHAVDMFFENDCDVVTTTVKRSYPLGCDALVFGLADLAWVDANVPDDEVREHVSLYFFRHPKRYRLLHLIAPERHRAPDLRFVLDYPEDLEFIRAVYRHLEPEHGDGFDLDHILDLLRRRPELAAINSHRLEGGPSRGPAGGDRT